MCIVGDGSQLENVFPVILVVLATASRVLYESEKQMQSRNIKQWLDALIETASFDPGFTYRIAKKTE